MPGKPEKIVVEMCDPFGTVIATGTIEVVENALRPAELIGGIPGVMVGKIVAGPAPKLADSPLRMHAEGTFTQQDAVNPHMLWFMRTRLAD